MRLQQWKILGNTAGPEYAPVMLRLNDATFRTLTHSQRNVMLVGNPPGTHDRFAYPFPRPNGRARGADTVQVPNGHVFAEQRRRRRMIIEEGVMLGGGCFGGVGDVRSERHTGPHDDHMRIVLEHIDLTYRGRIFGCCSTLVIATPTLPRDVL